MKNIENHIFIDTNCLISYLADKFGLRKKADSANWNALHYLSKLNGKRLYISSLSIAQLTATLQNRVDTQVLLSEIKAMCSRYEVVEFNKNDIDSAISNPSTKDIEDRYQYQMSQKVRCLYVMTNNVKDYAHIENIVACTPNKIRKLIF